MTISRKMNITIKSRFFQHMTGIKYNLKCSPNGKEKLLITKGDARSEV